MELFFKRIGSTSSAEISAESIAKNAKQSEEEQPIVDDSSNPVGIQTDDQIIVEPTEISEQSRIGSATYERDPGKRQQIWELPLDKQEEARRFYITEGPYQHT